MKLSNQKNLRNISRKLFSKIFPVKMWTNTKPKELITTVRKSKSKIWQCDVPVNLQNLKKVTVVTTTTTRISYVGYLIEVDTGIAGNSHAFGLTRIVISAVVPTQTLAVQKYIDLMVRQEKSFFWSNYLISYCGMLADGPKPDFRTTFRA